MSKPLIVIDTNVFISAQLIEGSTSAQVFDKILQVGNIALSEPLLSEYMNVIYRKKLDKYLSEEKRQAILRKIIENALMFTPTITVGDCRDRKDNIILELAITCGAACIVTGDADLKIMHPFRSIPILSGSEFLTEF
ncbi:putative PIN family toxin of toxin-antitoxin system [Dyadobacter sp. BE34]|uniref:PIN family toxin of toxin-antitoxin system n=1 Tax=Dyadobacter fermentans TaxID=94254 RepID=A0ABU1QRM5_9BACT|nr:MULTISPECIES: putative toxin-antitoxin system toxin component, PIN family [Dyadobacter]MDR6803791.1 putative PIN family toxin of toxin-antitoxin system [Dyadobacter fermentans]MDR7041531.1 putative PIN family toxin of toxin-antitoxin system [Dyadobacter sp. BE242]MDR7195934.1 putative PIN family toxin of toxin-antitoxin system [Dyadobacter sp. BE34]MDR7213521.1 putative PIN family toxin of toxin-antitoxin system [Dyadobacter sp. BE31]MDR7261340.1 putative PIN family toxin of toxin-antitoxin